MKLAKLSLAAIMAAGALATTANATPLEEAIKDVEIKGFMRYRYYYESDATASATKAGTINAGDSTSDRHRFSNAFTFITPVADNLTAGFTVSVERNEYAQNQSNGTDDVTASKMWFKYATKAYSVRVGKQEIATPWTEPGYGGSKGTGAVAMYTGMDGVALAAAGFVSTSGTAFADGENLYAAAAIGSAGPVNYQVWAARMTNVFDSSIFAQVDGKFGGFGLKAQMNNLKLAEEQLAPTDEDSGMFYGVEGTFAMNNFNIGAGYTSNDDDQGIYTLDADDMGTLKWGKQIYYTTTNAAGADTMAVFAGASFGKVGVGAGYVDASVEPAAVESEYKETYVDASYKYSKNFKLSAYYSIYEDDQVAANDNDEFRFEAKYSF